MKRLVIAAALIFVSLEHPGSAAESPVGAASSSDLQEAIAQFESLAGSSAPSYEYALVDLNADSMLDAVVLLTSRGWCGSGGCTMLIFKGTEGGFSYVSRMPAVREPIRVLSEKKNGWHTICVLRSGGGGPTTEASPIRFDGMEYRDDTQNAASAADLMGAKVLVFEK